MLENGEFDSGAYNLLKHKSDQMILGRALLMTNMLGSSEAARSLSSHRTRQQTVLDWCLLMDVAMSCARQTHTAAFYQFTQQVVTETTLEYQAAVRGFS